MTNLPRNLPALLRAAGLTVIEVDGWEGRGRPASTGAFNPVGVLNHHTGSSAKSWTRAKRLAYARFLFLTGRSDLPAPLCHLSLGPDGEVYVGAAGRTNHAGTAKSSGSVRAGDGNELYIGIEWMLSGTESIPAVMYDAGVTLNAVLLREVTHTSANTVSCHYNTSVTGKWDIGDPNGVPFKGTKVLDIEKFRAKVAWEMGNAVKPGEHAATKPKTPWRSTIYLTRRDLRLSKKYADRAGKRLAKSTDHERVAAREAINKAVAQIVWAYNKTPVK